MVSLTDRIMDSHEVRNKETNELEGLKIRGIALTEGVHNDVFYDREEIRKSHEQLKGKQLRVDHSKSVKDVVGRVDDVEFFENANKVGMAFEATVVDENIASLIRNRLVDGFSVGVMVDLEKEKGQVVAKDFEFKELSIVTDPADDNSRLTEVMNSKQLKEYIKKHFMEEDNMVRKNLAEEEVPKESNLPKDPQEVDKLPPVAPKDEEPVSETEKKMQDADDLQTIKDALSAIMARIDKLEGTPEEMEEEEPKKEEETPVAVEEKPEEKKMRAEPNRKTISLKSKKVRSTLIRSPWGPGYTSRNIELNSDPYGTKYGVRRKLR